MHTQAATNNFPIIPSADYLIMLLIYHLVYKMSANSELLRFLSQLEMANLSLKIITI